MGKHSLHQRICPLEEHPKRGKRKDHFKSFLIDKHALWLQSHRVFSVLNLELSILVCNKFIVTVCF